jgi:hypothetical protein
MDGDTHVELYANTHNFAIVTEGPDSGFFGSNGAAAGGDESVATLPTLQEIEEDNLPLEVIDMFNLGRALTVEDVDAVRGLLPIDDDNEPAPENEPDNNQHRRPR